ncbi:hypothetical protein [Microbispora sp. GKU 823]|uniref:hypothetical protein n=1 Tax=Microbispora sp. GKU 823 TaxID=1652100 RepID=UPI0009CCDC36|nr:hypothetical protein [Microbispora sp. GKU 823]OPG12892.1 hypothetical protein B1L11_11645 [Microbispora sp. GKU 823]
MDTHITREAAKARTDVTPSAASTGGAAGLGSIRLAGAGLTIGALAWAASIFVYGTDAQGMGGRIHDLTGLAFQLGVFCLLRVQMRTRAVGTSRGAAIGLRVEAVLLAVAGVWSLLHGVLPDGLRDQVWLGLMDIFWPLSMFGMFAIGVKLALAARWRGMLRWWPLVAETWAVATVPTYLVFGDPLANWVGGCHLVIGYALLGLLLTRRPELTVADEENGR